MSEKQPVWPRKPTLEGNNPKCKHEWEHKAAVMGTMHWRDCNKCGAEMWPTGWKKPSKAYSKRKWVLIGSYGGED